MPFQKIFKLKMADRAALNTILVCFLFQNGFLNTDIGKTFLELGSFFH